MRALLLTFLIGLATNLSGAGTAFTYQGRLSFNGVPANGLYDLKFALFDAAANGNQIGASVTNIATEVTNGVFTSSLDFGAAFGPGDFWLQLMVRTNGSGSYTTLNPRQQLNPVPLASFSVTAGSVHATNVTGRLDRAQLPALSENISKLREQNAAISKEAANLKQQLDGIQNHPD
jgi:hypothetical protein